MRLLVILTALALTGCASDAPIFRPHASHYRSYDPCIKCGERFQQIPNFENEAQIRWARGERW